MRGVILVTDFDWYRFLAAQTDLDEVNFWRPSDTRTPRQLQSGMPVLFKLRKRHGGSIVGYGTFAKHKVLPAWLAWDCFGVSNGAETFAAMRARIERLRADPASSGARAGDYEIGCLMLSEPVFLPRESWITPPEDWPDNAVQGAAYDLSLGEGARVWAQLLAAAADRGAFSPRPLRMPDDAPRYSEDRPMKVRLGQGTFRVSVIDAYQGACAVTGEHSLPALEAAHIRPFSDQGPRDVTNGLLLRSDLHRLFDRGYVGVSPDYRFIVSDRLRDDYSNGHSYYPLAGRTIKTPSDAAEHPDREQLEWHIDTVFRR